MSEKDKFEAQKKKLDGLCEEHNLSYRLELNKYPMTLTLRPLQGMFEQLSMLDSAENGADRISQDAYLMFWQRDGEYGTKTFGTFTINEALMGKFRNVFKKLEFFYCQFFRRECIETGAIRNGLMPEIDEEQAEQEAEPNEEEAADLADEVGEEDSTPDEDLITAATQLVRTENTCSSNLLRKKLKIGYAKALHLMDLLEQRGVVGPFQGSAPREVLPYDLPDDGETEA